MGAQRPRILHRKLPAPTAPSSHSHIFHFLLFLFLFLLTLSDYNLGSSRLEGFESILRPEIKLPEWRIEYSYDMSWHTRSIIHKPPCYAGHSKPRFECSVVQQPIRRYGERHITLQTYKVMTKTIISFSGDCRTVCRGASGRCGIFQNVFPCNLCILYFQMANKLLGHTVIELL
jgi:hypothetical protein